MSAADIPEAVAVREACEGLRRLMRGLGQMERERGEMYLTDIEDATRTLAEGQERLADDLIDATRELEQIERRTGYGEAA